MSLARQHRDNVLGQLSAAAAPAVEGGLSVPANSGPEGAAVAQVTLRLMHDQRRLKQIESRELKIEAKRDMIPNYSSWITGILAAGQATGHGVADPVLPTIMVWKIDTGDYVGALKLAEYVLRHGVPLPPQFKRSAATLIVEEIADAAIRDLTDGHDFPLAVLEQLETLTGGEDMPDEVRAKLFKAIGMEYDVRAAAENADADAEGRALEAFRRAHRLNERGGVKDRIRKLERAAAKRGSTDAPSTQAQALTETASGDEPETRPPAETADLTPNDDAPVVVNAAAVLVSPETLQPITPAEEVASGAMGEPVTSETKIGEPTADLTPNDDAPVVPNPAATPVSPDTGKTVGPVEVPKAD